MEAMDEEKSVLRRGGLAGILAGILFFLAIIIAATTLLPLADDPEGVVMMFPDLRAALTVVEGVYLVGLILWVTLLLTLYWALRGTSFAPALGSVLGLLGIAMLAVGSLVYVALAILSGLYHAPEATPEEQATLGLIWQGVESVFTATDAAGLLLLPIGVIVLGVAMRGAPAFGKGFGRVSVVLGVVAVVGMSLYVVDPLSPIALFGIFLGAIVDTVIFPILLGWKVYRLSRAPVGSLEDMG